MRIGQVKQLVAAHFKDPALRKKSLFLEGPSGIGKSHVIGDTATEFNVELRDVRLSQMDPVDLRGIPFREAANDASVTRWARPDFLYFDPRSEGILFLDELTSANPGVFPAAYQLVLDRRLGDAVIPEGWMIIAAGNRVSDRGMVNQMPAPLINRFVKISCESNLDDFMDWAFQHGIHPQILTFLQSRADYLHHFDPQREIGPFPTPRSWASANDYMDFPRETRLELLKGTIGEQTCADFETFLRVYDDIPKIPEIEADPDNARVPDKVTGNYAVAIGIAAVMTVDTMPKFVRYLHRLRNEYSILAMKFALKRNPKLHISPAYPQWASKYGNELSR